MKIIVTKMGSLRTFSGRLIDEPEVIEICNVEFPKEYEVKNKCCICRRLKKPEQLHIATFKSGRRSFEGECCSSCIVEYVEKNKMVPKRTGRKKC